MELFSAAEMREADRHWIEDLGIPGPVLMENAGLRCVELLDRELGALRGRPVVVSAGKGNNGGDGFVIARHLSLAGAPVRVFLTAEPDEITGDARVNLNALLATGVTPEPAVSPAGRRRVSAALESAAVAVDALLGTGLSGAPKDPAAAVIRALNRAECPILAVDLPSGVNADTGEVAGDAVRATWTVTFARPKTGLLLHPAAAHCGALWVGSLGAPEGSLDRLGAKAGVLTADSVAGMLPGPRQPDSHKGTYGRVFVVGGSSGMSGAVVLACQAALRAGAGLVTAVVPEAINTAVEAALLEATSIPAACSESGAFRLGALDAVATAVVEADAVALGPGLSRDEEAAELARRLLPRLTQPTVIDADGLRAWTGRLELVGDGQAPRILTPHPGEAAALLGTSIAEVQADRCGAVLSLAAQTRAVVVLKGSRTLIASPAGDLRVNVTGNPGMATGGSGDVLTGLLAALLAQGLEPFEAACAGVCLHGLAGDLAAETQGQAGVIAGDLVTCLPRAWRRLPELTQETRMTPRLIRIV